LATDIDIGSPAIVRPSYNVGGLTYVDKANPANASGIIENIQIYAKATMYNVKVATFYVVSGNTLATRDYCTIGTVTAGLRTFSGLDITVEAGDFIGCYFSSGEIYFSDSDGTGIWWKSALCIPTDGVTFSGPYSSRAISVYGTGVTIPAQVTNVQATDGTYTDKVRVTWNAASGADRYYVWQGSSWVNVGNVTTYDHTGAPAPTITVGITSASDGTSSDYVALGVSGESANNGSSISYKVKAWNAAGYGAESASNSGYRGVGSLTYQWQRSSGDSNADYSNISGATTDPYNDTGAPENGDGRYYKCVENATGAAEVTTNADRGYRLALTGNAIFFGCNF